MIELIISASRRTDIPAFYSDWFFNRLREGHVVTRNPFNAHQLTKLRLDSSVVDAFVFWTKNPSPMIERLRELDTTGIAYYFQFTLTPYGKDMEPGLPDKRVLVGTFQRLASVVGRERVIWRYDPIFFDETHTVAWHKEQFALLLSELKNCTEKVVISFLDMEYNNTKNIRALGIRDGSESEQLQLAEFISSVAQREGLEVATCAEGIDLSQFGIKRNRCIDDALIERLTGCSLRVGKDRNQRDLCGCVASTDIGVYNTCAHACKYCYANFSAASIATNRRQHDPCSPVLLGTCDAGAVPFKAGQKSFVERQGSLF